MPWIFPRSNFNEGNLIDAFKFQHWHGMESHMPVLPMSRQFECWDHCFMGEGGIVGILMPIHYYMKLEDTTEIKSTFISHVLNKVIHFLVKFSFSLAWERVVMQKPIPEFINLLMLWKMCSLYFGVSLHIQWKMGALSSMKIYRPIFLGEIWIGLWIWCYISIVPICICSHMRIGDLYFFVSLVHFLTQLTIMIDSGSYGWI